MGRGTASDRDRPIRVVLADDQRVIRDGLALMLELTDGVEVAGVAADGVEAVELVRTLEPDVLLVDLNMPVMGGTEATRQVSALARPPRVVVLTTFGDRPSILAALRAGAIGYLTKDADAATIAEAIRAAAAGRSLLEPAVTAALVQAGPAATSGGPVAEPAPADGLTARELEVLALVAAGRSNHEIARQLVVSEATVKTHINHLFAKIGARDRAQAVSYAYRHDLV